MTTAVLSHPLHVMPKINWKLVCFAGIVATAASLVFYVYQIYSLTTGYYVANSYQNQISQLMSENKNLEVSFAENSFLGQVMQDAESMDFHKSSSVKYLQILDNSMAVAK